MFSLNCFHSVEFHRLGGRGGDGIVIDGSCVDAFFLMYGFIGRGLVEVILECVES